MDLLLDTHTFLWYSTNDPRLSSLAQAVLKDPSNQPHLSVASLWEIAIKVQLGKLRLHAPFEEIVAQVFAQQRLRVLAITSPHLCQLVALPLLHRDPFDRLLVSQALADGMVIVGHDTAMDGYGVHRMW